MTKQKLSTILTIIIISVFIGYFFKNIESFSPLSKVSWYVLVFIAATKILKFFFNGLFIQWTIEVFTKKFTLSESVYVAILSAVGNFFGPLMGGASIRALYLKKVHKLSYSFFLSTLAGYYVILFAMYSLLGVVSLLFTERSKQSLGLLIFFLIWFLIMLLLIFFRLPSREKFSFLDKNRLTSKILSAIYQINKGWRVIVKKENLLKKLIILGFLGLIVTAITTYIEFRTVGVEISFASIGLHTALSSTSILISFTPGAIGIKEGLLVVNSTLMNVTSDQVLQVAVIDRGINFVVIALLYIFSSRLKKQIKHV